MCPPASTAPAVELNDYPTNEAICKCLKQLKNGGSLPPNVLSDVDPYQHKPSNLPEDIWYFWRGTKKDAEIGFWKSTGEACEIYSTSTFLGLRKTLQYYEGQAPNGQRTNWMMQEYTITEKCGSKQDTRGLYRVFWVDDSSSGRPPKSELLEKNVDDGAGASSMANLSPDPPPAVADEPQDNQFIDLLLEDYVSRDDYIELNDLAIPLSRTTSSADSSCLTMSSEELFDSEALMRELGDDPVDQEIRDSSVNLNLSAPTKLKDVVIHPTTTASLTSGFEPKSCMAQTSKADPALENDKKEDNTTTSSSSSEGSSKEEKRNRAKKRKMMKYLCFLAF